MPPKKNRKHRFLPGMFAPKIQLSCKSTIESANKLDTMVMEVTTYSRLPEQARRRQLIAQRRVLSFRFMRRFDWPLRPVLCLLCVLNSFRHEINLYLDRRWDVSERTLGASNHEHVREVRDGYPEIARRAQIVPVVFQSSTVPAFDGYTREVALDSVESRGEDDEIVLVKLAIRRSNAFGFELSDVGFLEIDDVNGISIELVEILLPIRRIAIAEWPSRIHIVRLELSRLFRILHDLIDLSSDEVAGAFVGFSVCGDIVEGREHEPESIALVPVLLKDPLSFLGSDVMVRGCTLLESEGCYGVSKLVEDLVPVFVPILPLLWRDFLVSRWNTNQRKVSESAGLSLAFQPRTCTEDAVDSISAHRPSTLSR